ncbi:hypothetical protein BJ166DRAFT_592583 [Pestalotiopsis sp. NC0098]|nr:hypothetical protein BJ166DRAFT_592583 [Pestalotiopsis sp. NC0098]
MSSSPEQKFFDLVKIGGHIDESAVAAVFDELKPITTDFLVGSWTGGSFDTGHPVHQQLGGMQWAGKDFRGVDDVDPVMVLKDGARVWESEFGHARLREVKFRGQVSAAMVYDNLPIIDQFRYVDQDTVMGAMDNKILKDAGTYYFYLNRM